MVKYICKVTYADTFFRKIGFLVFGEKSHLHCVKLLSWKTNNCSVSISSGNYVKNAVFWIQGKLKKVFSELQENKKSVFRIQGKLKKVIFRIPEKLKKVFSKFQENWKKCFPNSRKTKKKCFPNSRKIKRVFSKF